MFQKIREQHGLAYSIYAFSDNWDNAGLTGVYLGADADQIPFAAKLIAEEMDAMTNNIDTDEVDRVRALLRSSLLMGLESPATRIEANAGQLFTYGKFLSSDDINDRLDQVSIDDIKRCAQSVLDSAPAIAIVGAGDVGAVDQALRR